MAVRTIYKQTDVGTIPEDWDVVTVGSEFSIQLGKMLDAEKNIGVPKQFIGNRAVQWGRFDLSDLGEVRLTPNDLIRFRLSDGDLLVCEGGEIGRAAIWNSPISECYYQKALHRLRPIRGCDVRLMRYMLERMSTTGFLLNFATQTSIAHLPKDKFETVPFPLPTSYEEREAIVEALSDVDALIDALETLIVKKRAIKQGAMQELLSGRRRLPGFSGEWRDVTLGDIAHIKTGSRNNQDKVTDGRYPFFVRSETVERIDTFSYDCEAILVPGEGGIGSIFHYIKGRFDAHQRVYVISRFSEEIVGRFIHFYMGQYFGEHAMQNTVKATVDSLRLPTFQNFRLRLPVSSNEQHGIAGTLSDMEDELEILSGRLVKARQLKQGMMQELLTGRLRLV